MTEIAIGTILYTGVVILAAGLAKAAAMPYCGLCEEAQVFFPGDLCPACDELLEAEAARAAAAAVGQRESEPRVARR